MNAGFLLRCRKVLDRWQQLFRAALRPFFPRNKRRPFTIAAYRGYGRPDAVWLKGRVLRDKGIHFRDGDSPWRNLINTIKRFNSREIPGAELEVRLDHQPHFLTTDAEGYFTLNALLQPPLNQTQDDWYPADVILHKPLTGTVAVHNSLEILIPRDPHFGVISDIDDTVLLTGVSSRLKWRAIYRTLWKNAASRKAFQEVTRFFHALQRGTHSTDPGNNPFFYVSNSPWNLYDFLDDFLRINQLPKGPILLRDFGLPYETLPPDYRSHKHHSIRCILDTYPELPFILIGDSGEKDADIYLDIDREYPGRILAIYIRDVLHPERTARVRRLLAESGNPRAHILIHYAEAARHAARMQFIDPHYFSFPDEQ